MRTIGIFSTILTLTLIFSMIACGNPTSMSGELMDYKASAITNPYSRTFTAQPYKGFMPFSGVYPNMNFSMEWFYVPLAHVMPAKDTYDWKYIENMLNTIASRGNQAAFRIYLNYPQEYNIKDGQAVPQWIWDMGIEKKVYSDRTFCDFDFIAPDYRDQRLIDIFVKLVEAFGVKYDGDSRIAYITAGLIGHWGEWHTYPYGGREGRENRMASVGQQDQVYAAYDKAFKITPVLVRYANEGNPGNYGLGFHDDSFAVETLGPETWHSYQRIISAGQTERWKTNPIGGEFVPDGQALFLLGQSADKNTFYSEDFYECVKTTHTSWLMMQHAFQMTQYAPGDQTKVINRANEASAFQGYDYTIVNAEVESSGKMVMVKFSVQNKGVAPLYYDLYPSVVLINSNRRVVFENIISSTLKGILPEQSVVYQTSFEFDSFYGGEITVAVFARNRMVNGKPIIFSNEVKTNDIYVHIGKLEAQ